MIAAASWRCRRRLQTNVVPEEFESVDLTLPLCPETWEGLPSCPAAPGLWCIDDGSPYVQAGTAASQRPLHGFLQEKTPAAELACSRRHSAEPLVAGATQARRVCLCRRHALNCSGTLLRQGAGTTDDPRLPARRTLPVPASSTSFLSICGSTHFVNLFPVALQPRLSALSILIWVSLAGPLRRRLARSTLPLRTPRRQSIISFFAAR